jgi:hypothetical protein
VHMGSSACDVCHARTVLRGDWWVHGGLISSGPPAVRGRMWVWGFRQGR